MSRKLSTLLTTLLIVFVMINIVLAPAVCIKGAEAGLLLWFNKLLPSLFPFIVLTNMLFNMGIIFKLSHFIGPITSKIFKISGSSFLTFLVGLIAGYPTGAKLSKQLLESKNISFTEAQKTFCFANNCGCLFIIGTIGSIFLKDVRLGYFLVFIHFLSAFTMLLLFRFYTPNTQSLTLIKSPNTPSTTPTFSSAFTSAVQNAMDTIVYVGGYIIFFSVIISILKNSTFVQNLITSISHLTGSSASTLSSLLLGSFEFSNGVALICQTNDFTLQTFGLISAIIAFGGFCVLFQSAHVLQGSGISLGIYVFSKVFQAIIAYLYTILLLPMFSMYTKQTNISFSPTYLLLLISVSALTIFIFRILSHTPVRTSSSSLQAIPVIRNNKPKSSKRLKKGA